jgi:hypothetical protein
MNSLKRGIAVDTELATWIYSVSRLAKISENKVYVRMLKIAREDLAPFDDSRLRRIFREPWEVARKRPALMRQMRKRSKGYVRAFVSARVTSEDKATLINMAKREKTTVSALQRGMVEQIIAKEG